MLDMLLMQAVVTLTILMLVCLIPSLVVILIEAVFGYKTKSVIVQRLLKLSGNVGICSFVGLGITLFLGLVYLTAKGM